MSTPESKMLTVQELCKLTKRKKGSIYSAIKAGRIPIHRTTKGRFVINCCDYFSYEQTRYTRVYSKINGELIVDPEKGEMSMTDAMRFLEITYGKLYGLIRRGFIPHVRKHWAIVLKKKDLETYKRIANENNKS